MDGFALPFPGFCYNRVVDFVCYIWIKPTQVVEETNVIVQNGEPGPDEYNDFNYEQYMNYGDNTSNMTYPDLYDEEFGENPTQLLLRSISPIFLSLGTVGNLMSLIIMHRLSREVVSTCLYLAVLCIMDTFVLYSRCGNTWLYSVSEWDVSNMMMMNSPSLCKVYPFVFNFMFHMMRWITVCIAVEGMIVVKYPSKTHKMCTRSRAEAVMLLLVVLLVCLNIHFFWSFELVPSKDELYIPGITCIFNPHGHQSSELFADIIWPITDTLLTEVMPTIIIFICVMLMIGRICRGQHQGDETHRAWQVRYQMDPKASEQLKITFLLLCVFYFPMSIPKMCLNLVNYLVENDYFQNGNNYMEIFSQRNMANSICACIEYAYLSLKFFLYLATSERFRHEASILLKCARCTTCGFKQGDHPSNIKHTESMANEPLVNRDGCQRSATDNSLHVYSV